MDVANDILVENTEVRLLLDGLLHCYGFDYREYEATPLKRRIWERVYAEGLETISGLQEQVLHDRSVLERLLTALSPNVPSMFASPAFYRAFRHVVLPILRTYPSFNVWVPGCSSGEVVYSIAIVLYEAGLLNRARLYASDLSEALYRTGKEGRFSLSGMPAHAANYRQSGGASIISDFYTIVGDQAIMLPALRESIVFSEHSLATDGSFHEFEVIVCPHALSFYNDRLRERAHILFLESLSRFGIVGLSADDETTRQVDRRYETIGSGWFRKTAVYMEV